MKNNHPKPDMTALAALLVFTVFAVCVLSVLLTGADIYSRLTDTRQQTYDSRTCAQYLTARVRQADIAGSISIGDFQGASALILEEQIDGSPYITRVYAAEGYLRELFTAAEGEFSPTDGEKIMKLDDLSFSLSGSTLTVSFRLPGSEAQQLTLSLRSGREVRP